jgi:ribosome-binding protein aMBF1 (putative translation factor)
VTIHAGADNDWSVTVTQGAKRPTKAQPVSPEAVGRAVRELGDVTARDAVEAVISHAREEAARRVAELSRQLEEARTTLAALEQDV